MPELVTEWRGREAFDATWAYQRELHARLRDHPETEPDRLILVEHDPVVTLGRHGDPANLPGGEAALAAAGIAFRRIERGGDITYHGPGQLVGYPIVNLRRAGLSLRDYLRGLEELLIGVLAQFGVAGQRVPGLTGVWAAAGPVAQASVPADSLVESRQAGTEECLTGELHKLAAIGVAVQGGVTYHGFALNVAPDLAHYAYIVPCGITDRPVGSLMLLLGDACPALDEVRGVVTARALLPSR